MTRELVVASEYPVWADKRYDETKVVAASEDVASCVARQWMRFALSRPEGPEDESSIAAAYENGGGDLRKMIGAITQTDAFRHRRLPE
jgi:hypothetical protein